MLKLATQGTYQRWSIPLGFGICTQGTSEVLELCSWCVPASCDERIWLTLIRLAVRFGLADRNRIYCVFGWRSDSRTDHPQQPSLRTGAMARHATRYCSSELLDYLQHSPCAEAALGRRHGISPAHIWLLCHLRHHVGSWTTKQSYRCLRFIPGQRRLGQCWTFLLGWPACTNLLSARIGRCNAHE